MDNGVFVITTGVMGVGKSYTRVRLLAESWLRDPDLRIVSNIDLNREAIGEYAAAKYGADPAAVADRIRRIPEEVIDEWRRELSGPWEYWAGVDLSNTHIIIDESHEVCSKLHKNDHVRNWQEWIRTIRHRGATVEFISQTDEDFPPAMRAICQKKFYISTGEDIRDPYVNIAFDDWYQLWAKFVSGKYQPRIAQEEYLVMDGKPKRNDIQWFTREPWVFELYNSEQATAEGTSGARRKKAWEKFGRLGFLAWFAKRNTFRVLLSPKVWVMAFVLFASCGGGSWAYGQMVGFLNATMSQQLGMESEKKDQKPKGVIDPEQKILVARGDYELHRKEHKRLLELQQVNARKLTQLQMTNRELERQYLDALSVVDRYRLEAERGSKIRMLTPSLVVMENGDQIRAGQEVRSGRYAGQSVVSINFPQREVSLSSGVVLRMVPNAVRLSSLRMQAEQLFAPAETQESDDNDPQAVFSKPVRRAPADNSPSEGAGIQREANNGVGGAVAPESIPAVFGR